MTPLPTLPCFGTKSHFFLFFFLIAPLRPYYLKKNTFRKLQQQKTFKKWIKKYKRSNMKKSKNKCWKKKLSKLHKKDFKKIFLRLSDTFFCILFIILCQIFLCILCLWQTQADFDRHKVSVTHTETHYLLETQSVCDIHCQKKTVWDRHRRYRTHSKCF